MKKQTRKKKKRVTVSYKCELRALPSLALLALLLSVCRSFKALYWQRSVLCSAVHVVVQCSGVHCRDGGRSKICGGWEGQAVIKSSFDEIYILLLCRPISGKGREAETAPLSPLASLPSPVPCQHVPVHTARSSPPCQNIYFVSHSDCKPQVSRNQVLFQTHHTLSQLPA